MHNRMMQLMHDNAKATARMPLKAEVNGDEAVLYLYDVIVSSELEAEWWGGIAPESFVKELNTITSSVIHLRINSPGGAIFAARSIEAAIRAHSSKIIAHVDGYAASAASFIAVACDEVEIAKGGFIMIHKGWTCACGNSDDFIGTAELLEKVDGTMAQTYADETGQSVEDIIHMMAEETWLTGQESVDLGFADRLADESPKANSEWNLAAYAKAPVAEQKDNNSEPKPTPVENIQDYSFAHYERSAKLLDITPR
ncbi:MAG: Clp protease ClpP [Pseudodesulfovibrio sp.]|nr:Clp protease ClpP [Pseudodesulfovibrio sp.]